jgi:serine phosphatase RsbU (regulator of sigma subunit)/PAS domain-containing protein
VPLRSAGRPVGSIAIAGRHGSAAEAVAIAERVAEQAGALVATARLVDDLRRGRDRLERILASLGEAVTVRDEEGRVLFANDAAVRLLGPGLDVAGDDGEVETTDPQTGEARWLRARSTRLEEGLVVTVTQDITAAKEAERLHEQTARMGEELQASLSRMQLLIDAGFGGLIRGVGNDILDANQTFLEMVGYDDVAQLPPWPQMTPAEWAQVDAEALRQMREHGKSDLFEKEYLRRDGSRVRVLIAVAVTDPETFEWLGVVVDVSARRAPDAQEQSGLGDVAIGTSADDARNVADVLGGLAAAILIQRPGDGIVYANQAAAEAMGMASPYDVITATPEQIAEGWETFDEDGVPLTAERYPSRRILLGERDVPPLVVRTIHRASGREFWRRIRARGVFEADGSLRIVVSMTEDITQERRAMLTQRLLADAGRVLSSSTDLRRSLGELVRLAVPELADWCSVEMPDEHGVIRTVAVAHSDPEKVRFAWRYDERYATSVTGDSGSAAILRGGPATLTPAIPDELLREAVTDPEQLALLQAMGLRSVIQAPIVAATGGPIGVLNLINAESGREFTGADLTLGEELGRRVGTAVQNARLHAERAEIAATLQRSLLPGRLPAIEGYELEYEYHPAGEHNWVGGDFLDAFAVGACWMMIVGDVAGHGAQAAALTARARHTLRAIGESTADPVAAVAHLNRLLLHEPVPAYVTVCVVLLREDDDGAGATARIVNAGHPLPYLQRDGTVSPVGRPGLLLGAWDTEFEAVDVPLRDGDTLTIYTDGVPDTRRGSERFGDARLEAILAEAQGAADTVGRIRAALDAFRSADQTDDTAVLSLHRLRR